MQIASIASSCVSGVPRFGLRIHARMRGRVRSCGGCMENLYPRENRRFMRTNLRMRASSSRAPSYRCISLPAYAFLSASVCTRVYLFVCLTVRLMRLHSWMRDLFRVATVARLRVANYAIEWRWLPPPSLYVLVKGRYERR